MRLFSELQQCPDDTFRHRVTMLERLHHTWQYDQLVTMTHSSSEADSEDVAFARNPLHSPAGHCRRTISLVYFSTQLIITANAAGKYVRSRLFVLLVLF